MAYSMMANKMKHQEPLGSGCQAAGPPQMTESLYGPYTQAELVELDKLHQMLSDQESSWKLGCCICGTLGCTESFSQHRNEETGFSDFAPIAETVAAEEPAVCNKPLDRMMAAV